MAARVRRWSDVDVHRHSYDATSRAGPEDAKAGDFHTVTAVASASTPSSSAPSSSSVVTLSMMAEHVQVAEEVQECVICLDELEFGKALFTAECGHRFHFSCLLENVNHDEANSDKCPICRKSQTQWPEQTKGLVKAHPFCEYQYCAISLRSHNGCVTRHTTNVTCVCPLCDLYDNRYKLRQARHGWPVLRRLRQLARAYADRPGARARRSPCSRRAQQRGR